MEIKKLITVTSSGENMKLIDVENNTSETIKFNNFSNIYIATAPDAVTVVDKLGGAHQANKGDLILKSNCMEIYKVLPPTTSMGDVVKEVEKQKAEREAAYQKEHKVKGLARECEPMCEETVCEDSCISSY